MVTLRKLVQEGREYYYLEHPVKKNGRVKKYSKYLGREVPQDIEDLKQRFEFEIMGSRFDEFLEEARKSNEYMQNSTKDRELDQLTQNHILKFSTSSLQIAGSRVTLLEMTRLLENGTLPNHRSHSDISKSRAHLEIVRNMYTIKPVLTVDLLLDWHWKLYRESDPAKAGILRNGVTVYGIRQRLLGVPFDARNPLMQSAFVHYVLYTSKFFEKWNDVIARLAMNCILIEHGLPILNIEFKDRKRYESALTKNEGFVGLMLFLKWYFLRYDRKIAELKLNNVKSFFE